MELRIYYDDTDAGGVVYHANYLKYFERGRTEYMLKRGFDPALMNRQGKIFVVTWVEMNFLAPARLGETIIIDTFLDDYSKATVTYGYKVSLKGKAPQDNKLLVTGKTKLALVDPSMKVQRFSPDFIDRLKAAV